MSSNARYARLPGTPEPMHHWPGHGGIRIAGDSWGPRDGPLVLLQHGGGQTRHAWKGAGEALGAAGYCAVAFDARGHGDTDWAPDGLYGQDVMVRDLECVVAALGNRRPVLVRGGLSDLLSEQGAQAFLKLCPTAEYVSVSGAAHMVAGDRNDIFASAVIEFLARAVPINGEPLRLPRSTPPIHDDMDEGIVDVP
ncbi:MAG: alpha/beta hydrolase [Ramlibacter sp.]